MEKLLEIVNRLRRTTEPANTIGSHGGFCAGEIKRLPKLHLFIYIFVYKTEIFPLQSN